MAKAIALKGGHVLALNRPSERATASSKEINGEAADGKVTDIPCDLMDFESVRQAADGVTKACNGVGLDALVLNAGEHGKATSSRCLHLTSVFCTASTCSLLVCTIICGQVP